MRRTQIAVAGLLLATVALPFGNAAAKCIYNGYDKIACTPYVDMNVVVSGSSYTPKDVTVELGARVIFQNLDGVTHTVTVENSACRATTLGTKCDPFFDLTLGPMSRLQTAVPLYTGSAYVKAGDYQYYCKVHSPSAGVGMTGTLHVVAL